MSLIKFVSQFSPNAQLPRCNQMLLSLPALGLSHEHQQVRMKSVIKFCGYLEHAEFKKRDIRYKASTRHDTKRMSWSDFQVRLFKSMMLFDANETFLFVRLVSKVEGCALEQVLPNVAIADGLCGESLSPGNAHLDDP